MEHLENALRTGLPDCGETPDLTASVMSMLPPETPRRTLLWDWRWAAACAALGAVAAIAHWMVSTPMGSSAPMDMASAPGHYRQTRRTPAVGTPSPRPADSRPPTAALPRPTGIKPGGSDARVTAQGGSAGRVVAGNREHPKSPGVVVRVRTEESVDPTTDAAVVGELTDLTVNGTPVSSQARGTHSIEKPVVAGRQDRRKPSLEPSQSRGSKSGAVDESDGG